MILSIVMPCLNEAETLASCIQKANHFLLQNNLVGEIIVADNGSTDASVAIAQEQGARVVPVAAQGYGAALRGGIVAAMGKIVVMGDADDSYDFSNLSSFIEALDAGHDLVMGNRFKGGIQNGAMPILHRYLGNPVLSFIGRLFFKSRVGDFHCGLRAFTKKAFEKMDLKSSGMEFASEMVVKASMLRMSIREVPTTLRKDGRSRPPHLNTWRDGWRHLRFLIMYAPNWFLLYPGVLLMMVSLVLGGVLLVKPIRVFHLQLDIHTLLYLMVAALLGTQLVFMYKVVKNYTLRHLFPVEHESMRKPNLEQSLLFGGVIFGIGIAWSFWNVGVWGDAGFGDLQPVLFMRCVIPAVFLISVGIQTIVTGFVVALIHDQRKV